MPKGRAREANLDRTSDTHPQSSFAKVTACTKCLREGETCTPGAHLDREGQCENCHKSGKKIECNRYEPSLFVCLECRRRHYTCRTERGAERCVLCEKKGQACVEGTRKQADAMWTTARARAIKNDTIADDEFNKIQFDSALRLSFDTEDKDNNASSSPIAAPPNKRRKQNREESSNSMAGPSSLRMAQRPAQVDNSADMNEESDATNAEPPSTPPRPPTPIWHGGPFTEEWPEIKTSPGPPPFKDWYNNHTEPYQPYADYPPISPPQGLPGKPGFKWNGTTKLFDRFTDELVGYKLNEKGKFDKIADEVPGYVFNKKTKYFDKIPDEPESMIIDPPESSNAPSYQDKGKGKEIAVEEESTQTNDNVIDPFSFDDIELPKLLCCGNCKLPKGCKIDTEGARILKHILTTGNNRAVGESHISHPSPEWADNPLYISIAEEFQPWSLANYNLEIYFVQDLHQGLLVKVTPTRSRTLTSKPPLMTSADAQKTPAEKLMILSGTAIDLVCQEHGRAFNAKFLRYIKEGARFKKGDSANFYIFGKE